MRVVLGTVCITVSLQPVRDNYYSVTVNLECSVYQKRMHFILGACIITSGEIRQTSLHRFNEKIDHVSKTIAIVCFRLLLYYQLSRIF